MRSTAPEKQFTPKADAATVISILLNVSFDSEIKATELIELVRGKSVPKHRVAQMNEFFYSTPEPLIKRFMNENNFTVEDLRETLFSLPENWQSDRFKEVLRYGRLA